MTSDKTQKPQQVQYAEWALWVWTTWMFLYGIYTCWTQMPQMEKQLVDAWQGVIDVSHQSLVEMSVVGYVVIAILSAWIIVKIGAGRKWARSSLMWGFALEIVSVAMPPYHGWGEYLTDLPDITLQAFAVYALYTRPGRDWFKG